MALRFSRNSLYDVDWWLISVSTIKRAAVAIVLLAVGVSGYLGLRAYLDHRAEVARAAERDTNVAEKPERSGYFLELEGDVKVKKKGAYEWVRAEKKLNLGAGDLVKTGASSSAHILLFDGTEYTIKSDSLTMIQSSVEDPASRIRNVAVRVSSGSIDMSTAKKNRPESRTEVATDTTATALGEMTQAGVSVNPESNETSVQIYRGVGEITSGSASLRLTSLEGVRVERAGVIGPKMHLLPPPELVEPPNLKQFAFPQPGKQMVYMSWRQVEGARSYRLLISSTPLFSDPMVNFLLSFRDTSVRVAGLFDGTYFWRVSALDANRVEGRPAPARRFRIVAGDRPLEKYDVTPPELVVEEPRLSGNIALVRGKTEAGALLTINGEQVDVESDGSFFHPVILAKAGRNDLVIVAQDASGNETRQSKTVYAEFY